MSARILLASYHFPPSPAVGGLRIAKFARFLPEFGWEPTVLTVDDEIREPGADHTRLDGLDGTPIVKTGELPRVLEGLGRLKSKLGRHARSSSPTVAPEKSDTRNRRDTLPGRLKRRVLSLLWYLPDEQKNWSLYAAAKAVWLIRRRRIDWVLSSGPPFSVHVIGVAAKLLTRAKWVADFRDPWIDMLEDREPASRSRLSDRLERWMEGLVARCADRIVLTTERMREAMISRYPRLAPDKFVCIPNSIDSDRLSTNNSGRYDVFTITYAGSLYFHRTPEPLFKAVSYLIKSGSISTNDVRIKLVGRCRHIDGVNTRDVVVRYGLDEVVEVLDQLPYADVVRVMQRSHLLLMLAPQRHRLVVPAKFFDYLGSGSVILGLAEPGATADLMSGPCFPESDEAGLRNYLLGLLREKSWQTLGNDPKLFWRYDARYLTERLAAEMARVGGSRLEQVMATTSSTGL
jgi:hypothetical protein